MGGSLGVQLGFPFYPPFPSGAGRVLDFTFPHFNSQWNGVNGITRGGVSVGLSTIGSGTGSWTTAGLVDHESTQLIRTFAVGDVAALTWDTVAWGPGEFRQTPAVSPTGISPLNAYRMIGILASTAEPVNDNTHDYGMQLCQLSNGFLHDLKVGIGIQFTKFNQTDLVVRNEAAVLTVFNLRSGAGWNTNQVYHSYEIRLLGPTLTSPSRMRVFVDNIEVALPSTLASWAAGTVLPLTFPSAGVGTPNIVRPMIINRSGLAVDNSICIHRVMVHGAPTEADLL